MSWTDLGIRSCRIHNKGGNRWELDLSVPVELPSIFTLTIVDILAELGFHNTRWSSLFIGGWCCTIRLGLIMADRPTQKKKIGSESKKKKRRSK